MCFTERTTNTGTWSACNSLQIVWSAAWVPACSPWELFSFTGSAPLLKAVVRNQASVKVTFIAGAFPSCCCCCCLREPIFPGDTEAAWPAALHWLLWGNSTVFQAPCMAKPARSLTTSSAGRDVLNIVFHISCAGKSLPCLLPGLMWSYPWAQHKSLRRGWVSLSERHIPVHGLVGTFPWVSVNRLGWWLFQYLPPNICSFSLPMEEPY